MKRLLRSFLRVIGWYRTVVLICDDDEYHILMKWMLLTDVRDPYMEDNKLEHPFEDKNNMIVVELSLINRILYWTEFIETGKETWIRLYVPVNVLV